jgi:hypothetical protein
MRAHPTDAFQAVLDALAHVPEGKRCRLSQELGVASTELERAIEQARGLLGLVAELTDERDRIYRALLGYCQHGRTYTTRGM